MDIGAAAYRRFLDGDDAGIEEIINEYKQSLVLYLMNFFGDPNEAEDLMEDVLVKLVVDRPAFRGKSSFKTWLFAIARNAARDRMRKNSFMARRFTELDEATATPEGEELLRDCIRDEQKLMLHRCMERLKPEYKQVLYLSYFEEFGNEDMARIMKKTKKQIENLLYRAKKSLEAELRKEGYEYENQ